MLCEETRQSLSQYVDDCVSLPARVAIDEHLDRCPVCRDEVIELRALRRRLSLLTAPTPPADLAATISNALAIEAAARQQQPPPSLGQRIARFIEPWVMPTRVLTKNDRADGGVMAERSPCEVYEADNVTMQSRH